MGFRVVTEIDEAFLEKVMEIDREVYEPEYVGEIENMRKRFRKNPQSFVCVVDEENDCLAGYINFFPCTTDAERKEGGLYESIRDRSEIIRDDEISPDEVALYNESENHLFILSIAVSTRYRDQKEVAIALSDGWIDYLNELQEQGYPITDILATAVSPHGQKWLRNHMFVQHRLLEDENMVYICREKYVEKLLENDLYFKSFHDDIYLMLPLADNKKNHYIDKLYESGQECPEEVEWLIDEMREYLEYECDNSVASELDYHYMGTFTFLHTTDEYACDGETENSCEDEVVVGEEPVYAILTSHRKTHMYVLTLLLVDCAYSTTQVEDQLSHGYLKIRKPGDDSSYIQLYEYIRREYGLLKCGDGKCLLCMSNMPKNAVKNVGQTSDEETAEPDMELQNILMGEVYNSMFIDYHIKSGKVAEMCRENHAQYDYYDAYLSEKAIAFILHDFYSEDDPENMVENRIRKMASYLFIAELVMFQNTALAKATIKISNALDNDGDISYEQVLELYRDFGKTVRFWEIHNFKYAGTQAEAANITEAFANQKTKENYFEHQEFLEHIVELKSSQTEARNGTILNIVATILALIQIQPFIIELLEGFYGFLGIEAEYASQTFNVGLFGGTFFLFLGYIILRKKSRHQQKKNMSMGK